MLYCGPCTWSLSERLISPRAAASAEECESGFRWSSEHLRDCDVTVITWHDRYRRTLSTAFCRVMSRWQWLLSVTVWYAIAALNAARYLDHRILLSIYCPRIVGRLENSRLCNCIHSARFQELLWPTCCSYWRPFHGKTIFWCFQESEIRRSRPFWDVMQRLSHFMNGIHALTFIPRQIRSQSHSQCYRWGGANDDPGLYQRRVQDLQTGWPWGGYWQHPPTGQRLPSLRLIR